MFVLDSRMWRRGKRERYKSNALRFAYVSNAGDNSVSIYALNITTGRLKFTGKVATGTNPVSITVDPSGKYLYAANNGSNNVFQYTIGPGGSLTAMSPASITAGTNSRYVTVEPSGKYVYVANSMSNNVSQYTIGANGSLTAMSTATVAAGTYPVSIAIAGDYQ